MNEITLFPGVGSHFDRHHTFVVRYKVGEDLGLDMHTDDSDVTFNVCLGKTSRAQGFNSVVIREQQIIARQAFNISTELVIALCIAVTDAMVLMISQKASA